MVFRFIVIALLLFYKLSFADVSNSLQFESMNHSNIQESNLLIEPIQNAYNPDLDPSTNCSSWGWWCDITFGVKRAEESGVNGIIINGYAYHPIAGLHWPTGYASNGGLNEFTPGLGYTRTFYNPQYNTEYTLYAMGFVDSFYKPELHVGYMYQKYFDMNDAGNLKWGIGYTPFIFVKSSMIADAPIPLPGAALVTSIKYDKVDLMMIYFNVLFFNARIDF